MTPLHRLALAAFVGCGAITFAAAGLDSANSADEAPQPTAISWRSPAGDPARGEQLAQPCLACHAENSPATIPAAPLLSRQRQSYIAHALFAFRDGQRQSAIMGPMVQELKDQDVRDIAAYLGGGLLDKPPTPNTGTPAYQRAIAECTWCHGETGIGEFESMPVLAGQDASYLVAALEEYRSGVRTDPTMRAVVAKLSPEEAKAMADYYSGYQWLEKLK